MATFSIDLLSGNQYLLTGIIGNIVGAGGTTVTITGNTAIIRSTLPTGTTVSWGDIYGTLTNQTDLVNALNLKLDRSIYQTYTGTTVPNTYLTKSNFNSYTGTTVPNTYLTKTLFNDYSGNTQPIIDAAITGVTNLGSGVTLGSTSGKRITLKSISTLGAIKLLGDGNNLIISGESINIIPLQLLDLSGGTDINTISGTSMVWTTQEFSGSGLNFTGGSKIFITSNGVYEISYLVNIINETNSTKNVGTVIKKNGNVDITPTSSSSMSIDSINNASTNVLPPYLVSLSTGDYIELIGFRIGNSGSVSTKPSGSWLKIMKNS